MLLWLQWTVKFTTGTTASGILYVLRGEFSYRGACVALTMFLASYAVICYGLQGIQKELVVREMFSPEDCDRIT